jgi:hypothetical protein
MTALNESPELAAQAYEIADSMSMCDIECNTHPVEVEGVNWWNTAIVDPQDDGGVAESLAYLDARGLVIRHPARPELVRFTVHEKPAA